MRLLLVMVFKSRFLVKSYICSHSFPELVDLISSVTMFAKYICSIRAILES
jgi:hypothetical protein